MKQFVSLALVLFASVAAVQCSLYGAPLPPPPPPPGAYGSSSVQQVDLASLGGLANLASSYLNSGGHSSSGSSYGGAAPSYAPAKYVVAQSAPAPGPASASSYSAAPTTSYAAAPSAGYAAAPSAGYGAAAPAPLTGYGGASAGGYGSAPAPAPKFSVLPAYVSQINPGKHNYKSYQSPIQYSTVALPIIPSGPVAKLYVPEQSSYGGTSSYGGSSSAYGAPSISIGY